MCKFFNLCKSAFKNFFAKIINTNKKKNEISHFNNNQQFANKYLKTNNYIDITIQWGIENNKFIDLHKTDSILFKKQRDFIFDYADVKISGITEASKDLGVVFCMYVNDGGSIFYLDGGVTSKAVALKSYNDINS